MRGMPMTDAQNGLTPDQIKRVRSAFLFRMGYVAVLWLACVLILNRFVTDGSSFGAVITVLTFALPVIMAGVRTALVLVVGTATLATFINGGGLGAIIQTGISLFLPSLIVAGAVLVALLALLIEWLGRVLELVARPKGV